MSKPLEYSETIEVLRPLAGLWKDADVRCMVTEWDDDDALRELADARLKLNAAAEAVAVAYGKDVAEVLADLKGCER